MRVSGNSRFGGTVTFRFSRCAPGATAREKRRFVHRQAPFSRMCQPSTSWVTGGESKRARAQQAEDALVALRVPQDGVFVANDEPVADFPSAAIDQGAQAGFGEDPVVGLVAAQTVAAGEKGDGQVIHFGLLVGREARDGGAQEAIVRAGGQGFEDAVGVLEVVENAEAEGEAAAIAGAGGSGRRDRAVRCGPRNRARSSGPRRRPCGCNWWAGYRWRRRGSRATRRGRRDRHRRSRDRAREGRRSAVRESGGGR